MYIYLSIYIYIYIYICVNAVNVTHACSGPPLPPFPFAQRGQAWLVPRGRWGGEPDWRNTDSRRLNPTESVEASFESSEAPPPITTGPCPSALCPLPSWAP